MKNYFNLLNILTQSHSHTLSGFRYPQKIQSIHKSRQKPSVWHSQSQVCLPAALGLPASMLELWGHRNAGGEVLMMSSYRNYKSFNLYFDWGWGRTKCIWLLQENPVKQVRFTTLTSAKIVSEDKLKKGRREDENSFKIEEDSEEEYRITTANHREPRNKMSLIKKKNPKPSWIRKQLFVKKKFYEVGWGMSKQLGIQGLDFRQLNSIEHQWERGELTHTARGFKPQPLTRVTTGLPPTPAAMDEGGWDGGSCIFAYTSN